MKHLLTALALTLALSAQAQREQLLGTLLDRSSNRLITNATVIATNDIDRFTVLTDSEGKFDFPSIYAGRWRLVISLEGYSNYEPIITIQAGTPLNMGNVYMYPVTAETLLTDVGALESENTDYAQAASSLLSSSQDVFTSIATYKFGDLRFKARGYDYNLGRTYLNGLLMNDINTGNSPYTLWGGLNDAMRSQEASVGMQPTAFANGNIAGMSNVTPHASAIRRGYSINYAGSGSTYAHRLGVTWSGEVMNDFFLAYSLSARYSPADNPLSWTTGVFAEGISYFLGLEKKLSSRESLSLTVLGAPIKRGTQGAVTQEVYDLLDDPYYNPNWGYQNGKVRNARIRNSHEPVVSLDYTNRLNNRLKVSAAANYRFGRNGYTAFDWYDAPDPRPDYYRNLPSYYINNNDPLKALNAEEGWLTSEGIRHIDFDKLYNVNYNNKVTLDNVTINGQQGQSITGTRSKYVIENRRTDQQDINTGVTVNALVNDFLKINGGVTYRWNRTEYFKEMYDLLGGDFWVDIDGFAERTELDPGEYDYRREDQLQNDMNNPNRIIKKGDKFGYDYYAYTQTGKVWGVANYNVGQLDVYVGGDVGFTSFYREGLYRKGLFPDNSFGKSETLSFVDYSVQAGGNYRLTGNHIVSANVNKLQQAPYFQNAFLSPKTRNTTISNLEPEKIFASDVSYNMRTAQMKFRLSGFYTTIRDRSKVMSFYDDANRAFSNFAMSGIDQRHLGVEFGADVYVMNGFSLKGAVAYGDYVYTSNPLLTQTQDNDEKILMQDERVYWKNFYVAGTPQLASSLGVEYKAPRYWSGGLDVCYYDYNYIDMNPLRRTDAASGNYRGQDYIDMVWLEKFEPGYVVNANVGYWRTLKRKYNLGVMLTIKNLLNNQNLKSGGYEQSRLRSETAADGSTGYTPFDSKYYYMNGVSYSINVFLRF